MSERLNSRDDHKYGKFKRRRYSQSPSPIASNEDEIIDWCLFKFDLCTYLADNYQIKDDDDFFRFYSKFLAAHKLKKCAENMDRNKFFPIAFRKSPNALFDKFPAFKRNGNKLPSNRKSFDILLEALRTYQDFQQKTKFSKLRQLRQGQKDLPIATYKNAIMHELTQPGVLLIAGDTGCGKSTQLPQFVREAGFKRIAVTQPRRLACVSLANRVAYETLSMYKHHVGYQIRFEKQKNKRTNVIFLTEGVLLRQAADGDVMKGYDAILLDEVHERHLNMDFLVGIMKCLLRQQTLKLILMSATINLQLFEEYFRGENVKTIQVPGRLYPIDIIYKPILKDVYDSRRKSDHFDSQPYLNILELIDTKYKPHEKGDVLVFLQGLQEIQKLSSAVEDYAENKNNWIVLQLHSSMSLEDQDKVFYQAPEGVRKCIVSTNIAETSVTIDGVRFVIDSGKCNRMLYERCGVNRLFTTDISQDSAKQRCGRAGRTGPGYCYRLFSEEQLAKFDAFTPGEIHLVPLENLVLNMVTLGLSDVHKFPFLEAPADERLIQAVERLLFLEALSKQQSVTVNCEGKDTTSHKESLLSLTTLGDSMSKLPVDLTIGKMLITSTIFGVIDAALTLASLMSVQSPLNENRFFETKESREPFVSNHGEPITLLNLYKGWLEIKLDVTSYDRRGGRRGHNDHENSRKWCRTRGIEEQRFYEVTKLVQQFREILQDAELIPKFDDDDNADVITARERQIRNGELKQLKRLRAELKNEAKHTKKRLRNSRAADRYDDDDAEQQAGVGDIKDVEFRITNDFGKVQRLLAETRTDSFKDLMLLKVLLTSALYPQVAVEDEHNSSKTINDRLYHTKYKNYVFLRPTSYFAENPDFFQFADSDIEVPPAGYFSKKPLSCKHQLLVFQELLETKKTYLMNVYRMPALQTLLLFGRQICVNRTFTKLAVDDFLFIEMPFVEQGLSLMLESVRIRKVMKRMLDTKLANNDCASLSKYDSKTMELLDALIKFMSTTPIYNVKRLLPADVKTMYTYEVTSPKSVCIGMASHCEENPFDKEFMPDGDEQLGGLKVTANITWDCLPVDGYDVDVEKQLLEVPCPKCSSAPAASCLSMWELLVHRQVTCKANQKQTQVEPAAAACSSSNKNAKSYKCDKCKMDLEMTPVAFLKHKKYCVPVKQERS